MSQLLPVVPYPDPVLKKKSIPITVIDDFVKILILKMYETMYYSKGLGLSAIQVGVPLRVFVMDTGNNPLTFINPEIINASEQMLTEEEGCLSFHGIFTAIERHQSVEVAALDADLQPFTITLIGLEAVCAQHEIDHLNGITMLDHLSKLKRDMVEKRLKKNQKAALITLKNIAARRR